MTSVSIAQHVMLYHSHTHILVPSDHDRDGKCPPTYQNIKCPRRDCVLCACRSHRIATSVDGGRLDQCVMWYDGTIYHHRVGDGGLYDLEFFLDEHEDYFDEYVFYATIVRRVCLLPMVPAGTVIE